MEHHDRSGVELPHRVATSDGGGVFPRRLVPGPRSARPRAAFA